jgi:hypothetical protein
MGLFPAVKRICHDAGNIQHQLIISPLGSLAVDTMGEGRESVSGGAMAAHVCRQTGDVVFQL